MHNSRKTDVMTKLKAIDRLPKPTKERPFIQIEWIFDKVAELGDYSETSKLSIRKTAQSYIKFIAQSIGNKPLELCDLWNETSLVEWRDHLLLRIKRKEIGGKSARTLHGHVSQVMRTSYTWNIISASPIHLGIPSELASQGTSDYTLPFDFDYLESVNAVLRENIIQAKQYSRPYVAKCIGQDPRIPDPKIRHELGLNRKLKRPDNRGWVHWDNAEWYFSHVLGGKVPHPQDSAKNIDYGRFCKGTKIYGSLETVWERLGVCSWHKHLRIIFGLVFSLAESTGLNLSSLRSLKTDCFQDAHELTRQPYLRYRKPRGGGYKELHFNLFSDSQRVRSSTAEEISNDKDTYLWLANSQARKVKEIVDLIVSMTSDIRKRPDFPARYRDKLIVWLQARSQLRTRYGCLDDISTGYTLRQHVRLFLKPQIIEEAAKRLKSKTSSSEHRRLLAKVKRNIASQSFTVARFRATIATQMINNGATLEEIQAFLGHAFISTTLTYIRQHDLEISFYRDMTTYIETIKKSTVNFYRKYSRSQPCCDTSETTSTLVYETGLCHCTDPFNPSPLIQQAPGWKSGSPCRMWNRCLFCDKILITPLSLPKLFAYRARIELTLSSQVSISARKALPLIRAIGVIDAIERSGIFSNEELTRGRLSSETVDFDSLDMMLVSDLTDRQLRKLSTKNES